MAAQRGRACGGERIPCQAQLLKDLQGRVGSASTGGHRGDGAYIHTAEARGIGVLPHHRFFLDLKKLERSYDAFALRVDDPESRTRQTFD